MVFLISYFFKKIDSAILLTVRWKEIIIDKDGPTNWSE